MQVNSVNNPSFRQVSLSKNAFLNLSAKQIKMYHKAYDELCTNPNKIHFNLSHDNKLILTVLDSAGEFIARYYDATIDGLNSAILCCKRLPQKSNPVNFEEFLSRFTG